MYFFKIGTEFILLQIFVHDIENLKIIAFFQITGNLVFNSFLPE
jgi:hypothetical protein